LRRRGSCRGLAGTAAGLVLPRVSGRLSSGRARLRRERDDPVTYAGVAAPPGCDRRRRGRRPRWRDQAENVTGARSASGRPGPVGSGTAWTSGDGRCRVSSGVNDCDQRITDRSVPEGCYAVSQLLGVRGTAMLCRARGCETWRITDPSSRRGRHLPRRPAGRSSVHLHERSPPAVAPAAHGPGQPRPRSRSRCLRRVHGNFDGLTAQARPTRAHQRCDVTVSVSAGAPTAERHPADDRRIHGGRSVEPAAHRFAYVGPSAGSDTACARTRSRSDRTFFFFYRTYQGGSARQL